MKKFIRELQRRNVIKSALAYLVFAWLITQVMAIVIPAFELPGTLLRTSMIILSICFPCWLIFSWVYEITPEGLKKTVAVDPETSISLQTSNRLNYIIIACLVIAIGLLIRDNVYTSDSAINALDKTAAIADKSIAVLAFSDMSQEKDQEYFSDGISEEILNLLAKIPDLKVISRTSSFSFKGKEATTAEIGKVLNVNHILEGSIRKSGNTFRITAQLIKVSDGAHVWSETYDRDMTDIFKVQDEIAGRVTEELKVTLLGGALAPKTVDIEAYNLYLQSKQVFNQRTVESLKNSELLLRQSIALDSTYAPAWTFLSKIIYDKSFRFVLIPIEEGLTTSTAYAQKAIDLDPNYAPAYSALANYQRNSWDFKAANATMEKALALGRDNANVISVASSNALELGKKKEAIALQLKAIELDPLDYFAQYNLALYYSFNKQYDKAAGYIQTYLLHYPNAAAARSVYSQILLVQGDTAQALLEVEKEPDAFWKLYQKCMVVYAMGKKVEADALLKQLVKDWGDLAWPNIAHVYAFRGDKDNAFKWLDLAYEQRDGSTLEILNHPDMENLWGDPRWNKFINKLGLPKDHGFHKD